MRILMLGWEFPPYISGGLGTACLGITEGLAALGQEVIFVMPKVQAPVPKPYLSLVSAADYTFRIDDEDLGLPLWTEGRHPPPGLKLSPIDSPLSPYLNQEQFASLFSEEAPSDDIDEDSRARSILSRPGDYGRNLIAEVIRFGMAVGSIAMSHSFDVIHAHDWMSVFGGINARLFSGKPLILHIHALEIDRSGLNVNRDIFEIEFYGLNQADHVIAVSNYTKNRIVEFYGIAPEKITVVHNAVSQRESRLKYRLRPSGAQKTILFLGRITFQKGPDYFIEAAARVLQVMPEVRFIMAGTGDMMPQMIERVAELGIGRNFHFTGFLKGGEVEKAFAMSDIYVMPSVSEPFGISPLEAMSYDVPVIISRQSGVSELIKHALKIDFWKVEELADCMVALLKYPALRMELQDQGWEEVKKIRWEKAAEKILEVYLMQLGRS